MACLVQSAFIEIQFENISTILYKVNQFRSMG